MANRTRTNRNEICLNDREQYILDGEVQTVRHEKQICFSTETHPLRICI